MMIKDSLNPEKYRTLYAILFKEPKGQEWFDGTDENGDMLKIYRRPNKFSLSLFMDTYVMRETAEKIAKGRGNYEIIEVKEIIRPIVVGYEIIERKEK